MKKAFFIFCVLFFTLLGGGCSRDGILDSRPPFVAYISAKFSTMPQNQDLQITVDKGYITDTYYNFNDSTVVFVVSDLARTSTSMKLEAKNYKVTLKSNSALTSYPDGYQLSLLTDAYWEYIERLTDTNNKEIPVENVISNGIDMCRVNIDN